MVLSEPEEEDGSIRAGGGGWFYQSRRRRMVLSERNDGGLIYVAETRNQPLFLSLILSLQTSERGSTYSLKGKANEALVT
jgi:hypothetical protein